MAAGFGESYIRLWSLTGKGLKQLRTDLKGDEVGKIHDGTYHQLFPSLSRELTSKLSGVPSCGSQETLSSLCTSNSKTHRSFRTRLLPLVRSSTRSSCSTPLPPLLFFRYDDPFVVSRNLREFGRLQRTSRTGLGRRVGSEGNLFR